MKLCRNCKYHEGVISPKWVRCRHPNNVKMNPITGEFEYKGQELCIDHRKDNWIFAILFGTCGKDARWFEEKTANE